MSDENQEVQQPTIEDRLAQAEAKIVELTAKVDAAAESPVGQMTIEAVMELLEKHGIRTAEPEPVPAATQEPNPQVVAA